MLSAADLVQLPKGQAFALLEGGRLYKIRLPLPTAANDELMPDDLEQIAQEMEKRYYVATVGNTQLVVEGRGSGF
jgi:predicted Zn-dependent protease